MPRTKRAKIFLRAPLGVKTKTFARFGVISRLRGPYRPVPSCTNRAYLTLVPMRAIGTPRETITLEKIEARSLPVSILRGDAAKRRFAAD